MLKVGCREALECFENKSAMASTIVGGVSSVVSLKYIISGNIGLLLFLLMYCQNSFGFILRLFSMDLTYKE